MCVGERTSEGQVPLSLPVSHRAAFCSDDRHDKTGKAFPHSGFAGEQEIWRAHSLTHIIGFVAGLIAKFLHPGDNEPRGFILTTLLGIAGAFLATYIGQAIGWYRADEGAGLIGAVVGAIIVLVIWGLFEPRQGRSV